MKSLIWGAFLFTISANVFATLFTDLNFDSASREAAKTKKILLVDFYTTWCGPCRMLDKNTWTDDAVIQLLNQKTVALRVDVEKETELSKRFKIDAYPSVLLIKPDGTEIDRLIGYRDPKTFMDDFNAALEGRDTLARAREKVKFAGGDDPNSRMQFGIALTHKGKYAEALNEYLWCFDHGLEKNPSFFGPRLSFLLSYVKSLAAQYPAAREALITRRDERHAMVDKGSDDLHTVMDLMALNDTLDETEKNLAVYDKLPAKSQGRDLMQEKLAGQFLGAKRFADVLPRTGATAAFGDKVQRFELTMKMLDKSNSQREEMEKMFRKSATGSGVSYFEALAGLKRIPEARALADQILKFDSSPETHNALAEAADRAGNTELAEFVKK